jgi:hypothetical protein
MDLIEREKWKGDTESTDRIENEKIKRGHRQVAM